MSAAETDEPIERRFGVWTYGSPRNNVLGGAQIPPREETLWGCNHGGLTPRTLSVCICK